MKILCCVAAFLLFSCGNAPQDDPSFCQDLVGNWQRVDGEEGSVTTETWDRVNRRHFVGKAQKMKFGEVTFSEEMVLTEMDGKCTLAVSGPNEEPVVFSVQLYADSIVATNPLHDFPTKICYWKEGESLMAAVSNAEMRIDFAFVRK